jgi:hypothetical protein
VSEDLWWNFCPIELSATGTDAAVSLIFGNENWSWWQFGDLMTPWLWIA